MTRPELSLREPTPPSPIRSVVCDECWVSRGRPAERTCVCGTLASVICEDCGKVRKEMNEKPYWHCLPTIEFGKTPPDPEFVRMPNNADAWPSPRPPRQTADIRLLSDEYDRALAATVDAVQRVCAEITGSGSAIAPNPKYGNRMPPAPVLTPMLIQAQLNEVARVAMLPFALTDTERTAIRNNVLAGIRIDIGDARVELSRLDEYLEQRVGCRCW